MELAPAVAFLRSRGLDAGAYREAFLERRLRARMLARGAGDLAAYLALARTEPAEAAALERALAIQVTSFFRDAPTWDAIRARVAPDLPRRALAWSAGCASGEEAWSLAATLPHARVLATDVDADALAEARRAVYAEAGALAPWVERVDGGWRPRAALRSRVAFARHDLAASPAPGRFDLVVCRNVLIYFEGEGRRRAVASLLSAVRPGGFLVLGRTETLAAAERAGLEVVDPRERVFRRPPQGETAAPNRNVQKAPPA